MNELEAEPATPEAITAAVLQRNSRYGRDREG
jgi:hypothetical protein